MNNDERRERSLALLREMREIGDAEEQKETFACLKAVVEEKPSKQDANPTLALFHQWQTEDAAMKPEAIEAEKRLWEDFVQGINEVRREMGSREL